MKIRIEGKPESFQLEIKRCPIPGVTVFVTCPNCGTVKEREIGDTLNFPHVGKPTEFYPGECLRCSEDFGAVMLFLELTVRLPTAEELLSLNTKH
jgi:hypothetical protein